MGPEGHARLVLGLAETLANPDARLADKGLERRLDDLSSTQGDIAKLQQRLANIRTWTYAAHRPDWLENPEKWQDRTREIEDSLSDALHEALTARFVDRRTTALLASLKKEDALVTELTPEGDVRVEGHVVGRLKGLTFEPVLDARTLEGKAVRSAAQAAVRPLILERLSLIVAAPDDAFKLNDEGQIEHINSPVAHLAKGSSWMAPRVEIVGASEVDPAEREAARQRLEQWAAAETAKILPTHTKLAVEKAGDALEGLARGIAFRLLETGAAVDLRQDDPSLRLTGDQREALKGIGVRAGRVAAHVPDAQKPAGQRMIAILRAVFEGQPFPLAPEGAGSFALDGTWPEEALAANGYLRFGRRAVRADLAERLGWEIAKRRKEASKNAFPIEIDLASVVSCPADDWPAVLKGFGLAPAEKDKETDAVTLWRYASRARPEGRSEGGRPPQRGRDQNAGGKGPKGPRGPKQQGGGGRSNSRSASQSRQPDPDSPFAALAALLPEPKQAANKPKKKKRKPKPKPEAAAESAADTSFEYKPFQ